MNHEIYADHAATTPIEPLALEAMYTAYQEYANPAALYRSALHTKQTVEKARLTVAENLGCTPDHIFFTSGGSESNTWAIRGTAAGRPCGHNAHRAPLGSERLRVNPGRRRPHDNAGGRRVRPRCT